MGPLEGMSLLRIFKEALTNVIKHSKARAVEVTMAFTARRLLLAIKDNGRGISEHRKGQGRGMANMHKRAEELGGTMKTISNDNGTTLEFKFRIPLKSHELMMAEYHDHLFI